MKSQTKVTFQFNKEKDLFNIWETANEKSRWMDFASKLPPKILEITKDKEYEKCKDDIEEYMKNIYKSKIINIYANALNKSWSSIEKEYFARLRKITKKQTDLGKINAFITTAPRCPYLLKENGFMVNYFSSIPMAMMTAGHEIMHLHFHMYLWEEIESQLGYEKTHDLKEALTVLLNLEFNDLWFVADNGYDSHKELRKILAEQWKKEKDFSKLLKIGVDYLKIR